MMLSIVNHVYLILVYGMYFNINPITWGVPTIVNHVYLINVVQKMVRM
jgi:hypothetical protein